MLRHIIKKKHDIEDMIKTKTRKSWSNRVNFTLRNRFTPRLLPLDLTRGPKNFWFVNQISIILLLSIVEHDSDICGGHHFFVYPKGGHHYFLVSTRGESCVFVRCFFLVATSPPPVEIMNGPLCRKRKIIIVRCIIYSLLSWNPLTTLTRILQWNFHHCVLYQKLYFWGKNVVQFWNNGQITDLHFESFWFWPKCENKQTNKQTNKQKVSQRNFSIKFDRK